MPTIIWHVVRLAAPLLGLVLAFWYTESLAPTQRPLWLDRSSAFVVGLVNKITRPTSDFGSQLEDAFRVRLPQWASLSRDAYQVHVARSPYPLPKPGADAFDWHVMERWCNSIPNWSDHWEPRERVSDAYLEFLTAVDDETESRRAKRIAADMTAAMYEIAVEVNELEDQRAAGTVSRESYERRRNEYSRQQKKISEELAASLRALSAKLPKESSLYAKVRRSELSLVDDAGFASTSTPRCRTVPNIATWIEESAKMPPSLLAFGAATFSLDTATTKGENVVRLVNEGPSSVAGAQSLEGAQVSVKLKVRRVDVIQFDRSDWLDLAYLKNRRNGPWRPGVNPQFWGRSGSFSLLPYALILAYSPRLELSLRPSDLEAFKSWARQSGASVVAGPFNFSTDGLVTATEPSNAGATPEDSVRLYSNEDAVFVLGVISMRAPP